MPLYDWQCNRCDHRFEKFFKIKDKPTSVPCEECEGEAIQIVVLGHGGTHGDEAAWLNHEEVVGCLQKPGEKPIESRSEYNAYLKKNNIVPLA